MPVRADGDFVDQVSAVKAWAQAAHEVLVATASTRQTIEYQSLARQVQARSGISTKQPTAKWIGPLLGVVARQCQQNSLPLLTALAVRRDGSCGPAYDEILRFARIPAVVEDREEHALAQREAAYAQWGGTIVEKAPARVGGVSTVPAKATAKAGATSTRAPLHEPLHGNTCPSCFMQMSLTGICDNCD